MAQTKLPQDIDLKVPAKGKDGKTPVRGMDYWTEEDQNTIKKWVEDAILNGKW
ncbi:hypothetical protein [Limosilactobacillus oris]|uniref:hypothetical protein n=1 Tax=Limosilactobacillus oris TaxID=1632 RepID=UPI0024B340B1|nr:hypothetical protein [Limosilactobacillus oris]WHO84880.1 hypothetical protein QLX69_05780 [Limosilactobacillus oris]